VGHEEGTLARRSADRVRWFFVFMYDNSADTPRLVASGAGARTMAVEAPEIWHRIRAEVGYEGQD
jgi:hypothetical protein